MGSAGSTRRVGAIYASDMTDAPGFVQSHRKAFRKVSHVWYSFWGLKIEKTSEDHNYLLMSSEDDKNRR